MSKSLKAALRFDPKKRMRLLQNYWKTVDTEDFPILDVLRGDTPELSEEISEEIKNFYKNILELLECGLSENPELFKAMRSKILRGGNDAVRNLTNELNNYHILKVADTKEVFRWERDSDE